jgi:hypothetical protein
MHPARGQALLRTLTIDRPLEIEQRVDPLDRLQRQRRDRRRVFAAFGIGRDIGQDKELATRMSPTGCVGDPARLTIRPIQPVVSCEGVGLEDAGKAAQVLFGMLTAAIARVVEQRRRGRRPAERPVIAGINPDPAGVGLAFGQNRHGRVIAVQTLGRHDVGLHQRQQGLQHGGAGADLVGQGGQADLDTLTGEALALPVERLVLSRTAPSPAGRPRPAGWCGRVLAAG